MGLRAFSMRAPRVRVPPAIDAIMQTLTCRVQAFLAAGHVCNVIGTEEHPPLVDRFGVPIVVTGFEPLDILPGIRPSRAGTVHQLEKAEARIDNAYSRVVHAKGNPAAKRLLADVLEVTDRDWGDRRHSR